MQNPFRIINELEATGKKHDLISYDDSKTQTQRLPCFGFLFVRPTPQLRQLWLKLTERIEKHPENEQLVMQGLMRQDRSVTIRFLPAAQFRNGIKYGGTAGRFTRPEVKQAETGVAFVHMNWVIGIASKVQMLKHHGWWLI